MKGIISGIGLRDRTQNYKEKFTLRIETVWPDFSRFKNDLLFIGFPATKIATNEYKMLIALGGGIFIKWSDLEQARIMMALEWKRCQDVRVWNQKLWDQTPESFIKNSQEQTQYITNENDEESNREYKSGAVKSNYGGSFANNFENIDEFTRGRFEPTQQMFIDFIDNVSLAIQPQPDFNFQDDGKNFNTEGKW